MAILFSCKCRKSLSARDEFAGRKMKCSSCGAIVPIPAAKAKTAARPMVAVGASKSARSQTAPARPAAKPARPRAAEPEKPPLARPVVAPQVSVCRDTTQEQRATPWLRGDKQRLAPDPEADYSTLVRIVVLLVALAGVGGAVYYRTM